MIIVIYELLWYGPLVYYVKAWIIETGQAMIAWLFREIHCLLFFPCVFYRRKPLWYLRKRHALTLFQALPNDLACRRDVTVRQPTLLRIKPDSKNGL